MNIGDLVHWTSVYDITTPGLPQNESITGIVVDTRYSEERLAGDIFLREKHGRQEQVQVLCKTGALRWYPAHELMVVTRCQSGT